MSFDLTVWSPVRSLTVEEALDLYTALCEDRPNRSEELLKPDPAIQAFYAELTSLHPEIDDIPEEKEGDYDHCPWSCSLDRTDRHITMACVWSQADKVADLVETLAGKHGLTVFDPQAISPPFEDKKPWWRFW